MACQTCGKKYVPSKAQQVVKPPKQQLEKVQIEVPSEQKVQVPRAPSTRGATPMPMRRTSITIPRKDTGFVHVATIEEEG